MATLGGSDFSCLNACLSRCHWITTQESDVLAVVEGGDGGFSWLNTTAPYSCSIASPKKESKMKGLKTFIAYQLTPSVSCLWLS